MIAALVALGVLLVLSEIRGYKAAGQCRETQADFLNRLAARNYSEYAAFEQPSIIGTGSPTRRTLTDDTGLIEVDADDEDDGE